MERTVVSSIEEPAVAEQRPAGVWRGRLLTLACIVALLLLIVLGYSWFHHSDRSTYSAPVARLTTNSVTYLANGGVYVVAKPDGTFIALDQQDPNRANRLDACVVRWRPDLQGGILQEDPRCGGATFDGQGNATSGGPGLLHHPVRLAGKRVVVDIRQCMAGENGVVKDCADFRQ